MKIETSERQNGRNWKSEGGKFGALLLALACVVAQPAKAIILHATGDPTANTTEPTGALAGSGWQYEGRWGNFLGTAIAPQYFITAKHVGGIIGQVLSYQGIDYTTVAQFDCPSGDLRIWKVDGLLPEYAPIYTGSDEVGKNFVVIGRGTQRGDEVWSDPNAVSTVKFNPSRRLSEEQIVLCAPSAKTKVVEVKRKPSNSEPSAKTKAVKVERKPSNSGSSGTSSTTTSTGSTAGTPMGSPSGSTNTTAASSLKGWRNGSSDNVQRWGANQVASAVNYGGTFGYLLAANFDAGTGPNEGTLSVGDSGGAVFIQEGGLWKLAGINYGVTGPYKQTSADSAFYGAIFDEGGLYKGTSFVTDEPTDKPGMFYVTRISSNLAWIVSIITAP